MLSTLTTIVNTQCTSLLVFDYPANYQIQIEDQIEVYYVDTGGNDNLLDLTSDYEITDISETGFNVQLVTSYDEGILSIRRRTNLQQEVDFVEGTDFPAEVFEKTLDKHMMAIQEIDEKASRAIRTHPSESAADLILPNAEDRADKFIAFNSDGSKVIASEGSLSGPVENIIWDKLQFNDDPPDPASEPAGLLWWNKEDYALNVATGIGPVLQVGQESYVIVYNGTGEQIDNGAAVYPIGGFQGRPSVAKANSLSHVKILGEVLIATMDIPDGEFGIVTQFGKVRGIDTSSWPLGSTLWVSDAIDGALTNVKPEFPSYAIQVGGVTVSDADGEIIVTVKGIPENTIVNFWNGTFRETIDFLVTSNGTVITGSLTPANGHDDMTMIFSDGLTLLDTDPAVTIELVPGSDSVPVLNYVYIPKSTKVLTVSTSGWPSTQHIKVANILLKTAAATENEGALKNQNWNDHIEDTDTFQGHLSHIGERMRQEHAKWDIGIAGSVTIDSGPSPDDVFVAVDSGYVYQMHRQFFPALNMETGEDIHIVNNFATPYKATDNLNTETLDANGDSLANGSFSFVVWGVQNKTGQTSHLMLNLPTGKYSKNNPESAVNDAVNYSVYDIPKEFQGVGFLITRFTFVLSTNGLIWTLHETQDLRGKIPNNVAGGGSGGGAETTSIPIGSSMAWNESAIPVGYLRDNGQEVSRTTYSDLFAVIGTAYGVGDGSTTFNLPKSDFDSGWITVGITWGAGNSITINHGLRVAFGEYEKQILIRNDAVPDKIYNAKHQVYASGDYGQQLNGSNTDELNNCILQIGNISSRYIPDTGVGAVPVPTSGWSYKVILVRKDFPANSIIRATNTSVTLEAVTSDTIADLIVTNSATFQGATEAEQGITVPVLHVQDQKSSGTAGGTSAAGVNIRVLNIVRTNTIIGASLDIGTSRITLLAGTYKITASAPSFKAASHRIYLYNITDAADEVLGASSYTGTAYAVTTHSLIQDIFTITATKVFELRHHIASAFATNGLGVGGNLGQVEIYADVFIEKIG
jgi:hypothetical protein